MAELLPTILFYLFAAFTVASGMAVISVRNPVHAVFCLILAFFNAAGLFLLIGAEYLAMTLIIVYVGAVAVLFLFVVMMLDVNFAELREGFLNYLWIGACVAGIILVELLLVFYAAYQRPAEMNPAQYPVSSESQVTNIEALGRIIYTDYLYPFQVAGLILLVAMIGAIVLTLRHRPGVRRQNVGRQQTRTKAESIEVVSVPTGRGA